MIDTSTIKRLPQKIQDDFYALEEHDREFYDRYISLIAKNDIALKEVWAAFEKTYQNEKSSPLLFLLRLLHKAEIAIQSPVLKKRSNTEKDQLLKDVLKHIDRLIQSISRLEEPILEGLPLTISLKIEERIANSIEPVLENSQQQLTQEVEKYRSNAVESISDESIKAHFKELAGLLLLRLNDPRLFLEGLIDGIHEWKDEPVADRTDAILFVENSLSHALTGSQAKNTSIVLSILGSDVSEEAVKKAVQRTKLTT